MRMRVGRSGLRWTVLLLCIDCHQSMPAHEHARVCGTQVLALDVLRAERVVSSGGDRACRVWKIPEESQLLYRWAQERQ